MGEVDGQRGYWGESGWERWGEREGGRGWGRTGDGGWEGSGRVVGWNSTVQGVCTEGMTKGFGLGMVCYAGRELGGVVGVRVWSLGWG